MQTYNIKFIDFLANYNTVIVHNQEELNVLVKKCERVNLEIKNKYSYWKELAINNGKYNGYICFEYLNYKGLTFYSATEDSKGWYGVDPLTVYEI